MKYLALALTMLTMLLCGCLDHMKPIQNFQQKATAECEKHHSPAQCKCLAYPAKGNSDE